jgi:TP901 family phage tail tape measure protein
MTMGGSRDLNVVLRLQDKFSGALKSAGGSMQSFGRSTKAAGTSMTRSMTLPVVGLGFAVAKMAGGFEKEMNRVAGITGSTGQDFKRLEDQAKQLGKTTQFSAGQAAEAMGFLAMAGFDTNQIISAMPSTLQLAAAGNLDLARAADITSNIMSGYNMTVGELAHSNDVLTKTFTSSNVSLEQVGEAMKFVAPIASAAGLQFEEMSAAIGMMGNAGIQGSMAGTSLRMAIIQMLKPTTEASARWKELGIELRGATGNLRPLNEIMDELQVSTTVADDAVLLFGTRASAGMARLMSEGGGALKDFTTTLENSGGTAELVGGVNMRGFTGAMNRLRAAVEAAAISMGDSGLLEVLTGWGEKLASVFQRISEVNPAVLKWGLVILGAVAILGPFLIVLGSLITVIGGVVTIIGVLITATLALITIALSPIGLVVIAIIGAFVLLVKNWEHTRDISKTIFVFIANVLKDMANTYIVGINGMIAGTEMLLQQMAKIPGVGKLAKKVLGDDGVLGRVKPLAFDAAKAFDTMEAGMIKGMEFIEEKANGMKQVFLDVKEFVNQLGQESTDVWEQMAQGIEPVIVKVKKLETTIEKDLVEGVETAGEVVAGFFEKLAEQEFRALRARTQMVLDFNAEKVRLAKLAADAEIRELDRVANVMAVVSGRVRDRELRPQREAAQSVVAQSLTGDEAADSMMRLLTLRARAGQTQGSQTLLGGVSVSGVVGGRLGTGGGTFTDQQILDALAKREGADTQSINELVEAFRAIGVFSGRNYLTASGGNQTSMRFGSGFGPSGERGFFNATTGQTVIFNGPVNDADTVAAAQAQDAQLGAT